MLPSSLPEGRSIGGRVARPRVSTLPLTGSPPQKILEASPERIGLSFYNDGSGVVFLTDDPAETNSDLMFPIPAGASFTPGIAPFVPHNALYAVGAAGHSLRIWELVTMVTMPGGRPKPPVRPTRSPWNILRNLVIVAGILLSAGAATAQILIPAPGAGSFDGIIRDGAGAGQADVLDAAPVATDWGLVVRCVSGCAGGSGGTSATDKSGFAEGVGVMTPVGGVLNDTITADPVEDTTAALRITPKRGLHINLRNQAGTELATAGAPLRTDPTGATTQPVSGTVTATGPLTDAQLRATPVPVSGTVTSNQGTPAATANRWPVQITDGTDLALVTAAGAVVVDASATTQPVSGTVAISSLPNEDQQTRANSISVVLASNQIVCSSRVAISQTADTQVVTGAASSFIYICSIMLIATAAETINIIEGTGTVCATSPAALYGSTTEASGMALAANGGFSQASSAPFIRTQTAATNLCITQVGAGRIAGSISYVVAP